MDNDVGDAGADIDERLGLHRAESRLGRHERAEQREAVEVDHARLEAGLLHGLKGAADHVARRRDEEDAEHAAAGVVGELLERVEVQDRLLHRHRDEILHLKGQRFAQLVGRQPGQVYLADDDLLVRHPHDDLLGAELRLRPQLLQCAGDGVCVDDLTVPHCARRERYLTEPLKRRRALARAQLGGSHAGGPDVESHHWSSCHCPGPLLQRPEPRGARSCRRPVSKRRIGQERRCLEQSG